MLTTSPNSAPVHETPIKRAKESLLLSPKTAESDQKIPASLEHIDAQALFLDFAKIVRISEEEQQEEQEEDAVQRKLNYQSSLPEMKLIFSPKDSSMKKKMKIHHENSPQNTFESMILFQIEQHPTQAPFNQKSTPEHQSPPQHDSPKAAECFDSPLRAERASESGCWATRKKVAEES